MNHPSSHRRWFLLLMAVAAACSGSDDGAQPNADVLSPSSPLEAIVLEESGLSSAELRFVTDFARFSAVESCLSDAGFVSLEPPPAPPEVFTTNRYIAQMYIQGIRSGRYVKFTSVENLAGRTEAYARSLEACQSSQEVRKIADPLSLVNAVVEEFFTEIIDRTLTDGRYQQSLADQAQCFERLGYSESEAGDVRNRYFSPPRDVLAELVAGSISEDEAIAQLEAIDELEKSEVGGIYTCIDSQQEVYWMVRSEYETELIDGNPGIVTDLRNDVRSGMLTLSPYMSAALAQI